VTLTPSSTVALIVHAIVGLSVIGALAGLAAVGTITGVAATYGVLAIAGILLGTGSSAVGASSNPTTITTPVTAPPTVVTPVPAPTPIAVVS